MTSNPPQRQTERRGLLLWPVGTVLTLTFATAIAVAGAVFFAGWDLLGAERLKPEKQLTSSTLFDLVKLSFGVVAGAGALVALVVAYRRQRVDEDGALRDATRLHTERFTTAVSQLGDDSAAVRLGGVHALAGLADDAPTRDLRQTCVDVLCAYLRLPYTAETDLPASDTDARHAYLALREVRHTVIRLIRDHLRHAPQHPHSWQGHDLGFTSVVFDGGDFSGAVFSGGTVDFSGAKFSGGTVDFTNAVFSGGTVDFTNAEFSSDTVAFRHAVFSGSEVCFRGMVFCRGMIDFRRAVFSGGIVDFGRSEFSGVSDGTVDFSLAEFSDGTVVFCDANFSSGRVSFRVAVFSGGRVDLSGARFTGSTVDFDNSEFTGGTVDLSGAEFSDGRVSFRAEFSGGTVFFSDADFSSDTVDFNGAELTGGTVDFSDAMGAAPSGLMPPAGQPLQTGLSLPPSWYPPTP
ncbi:pentapeptide repeat-containing protein [Streptomyces sp. NPDC058685]|uniref:pentapeptide repeat-containing protein n=1 Tax=Streptomyces sp. NPDC058685 TaxID=3346598 RepID=UPI003653C71D